MKILVLLLILCSAISPIRLQEITESSGDQLTSVSTLLTTDWLKSETISSGEGPVMPTALENVDLMDDSNNGTDIIDLSLLQNGELQTANETSAPSLASTQPWTSTETTIPSSTTESQTTSEPSTTTTTSPTTTTTTSPTTTTTTLPTTTTTSEPTTTTTMETTSPSTTSTTTTTTMRTTSATTRPPTTTLSSTTKRTTKAPLPVTELSTKPSSQVEAPCEFMEEDFICETDISCFGEGTIDCIITEEEDDDLVHNAPESRSSSEAALENTDDYEEESATIGFFPPELVGRVPPRFSFPWHMKSEKTDNSSESSIPEMASEPQSTTTLSTRITTGTEREDSSVFEFSSPASSTPQINTMTTVPSTTTVTQVTTSVPSSTNSTVEITGESSTFTVNNFTSAESNITEINLTETNTFSTFITGSETVTASSESATGSASESTNTEQTASPGVRRKRDSNKKDLPASSESLKLTVDDSKKRVKSCKIAGNLHCVPVPTTASCKGRGTCKVISVEKAEKSTTSKGVENWAIAVIAICATAAALTIGLLVYLVVTSWKKLKVQPQNGVTTLNYVNSSPP